MRKNKDEQNIIKELSALHEISKSMQTLNLSEILLLILDGVNKVIGFDRARLYLINETTNTLECKMASGIEKEKIQGINLPLDNKENSMLARSIIERKPFMIEDADKDERVNKKLKELFNLKSFAVVPLVGRDKVLGAITADNLFSDRNISVEKFTSLITFANQAALALENAKMYDELKNFNLQLEDRVKIAAEELKMTQDKLIQTEKLAALGKLSAGIAHEIRNPLTSIKVLINSVKGKVKDIETEEDIKVIEDEIERVNQIIKKFLDFSRPKEPEFSVTDINQILEQTINLILWEIKEKNIILEKKLSRLPNINADKEQIKQVFLNLILNSLQAMSYGGNLFIISSVMNNFIRVEFKDTGEGIEDSIKNKLFEPFFTTKQEGIGLGLSIVRRIIDEHKGLIVVKPNKPKGTIFIIDLPV